MSGLPGDGEADVEAASVSLSITIQPEPAADERDAVVAAVLALATAQAAPREPRIEEPSRWAQAGRWEAIRRTDVASGWGIQRQTWARRARR